MEKVKGCALLCDGGGIIRKVLRDDFLLMKNNAENRPFTVFIAPAFKNKSLDLIHEAKQKSIALDFRLGVLFKEGPRSLYFIGISIDEQVLLIGADNHKEAIAFTDHLQQINNEQTNYIRGLLKERSQEFNLWDNESSELYDELTRVNNELVNLQRELSKKNRELEHLNQLKNKFLGMAAHDLRNPLGLIFNYTELLLEDESGEPAGQNRFVSRIKDLSEFMLNLVNELLDVSNIESGKVELSPGMTDLKEVLVQNLQLNQSMADKKQIRISLESRLDAVPMNIDKLKIEQIINNLLTNAIKFSPRHSTITIRFYRDKSQIITEVRDQGQGIKEAEMNLLFQPFQVTSTRGTDNEKSTGLGLYIAKRNVEAHGGSIWAESEYGRGAAFYFALPLG